MTTLRTLVALTGAALATACASPGGINAPASSPTAVDETAKRQTQAGGSAPMAAMEPRMKAMHEMHEKMMNAKTPEERQALMADHMKAMHEGMAAMKGMSGMGGMGPMGGMAARTDSKAMPADMAKHHQMMAQRMDMMQMMMEMMMDRMPAQPPAPAKK